MWYVTINCSALLRRRTCALQGAPQVDKVVHNQGGANGGICFHVSMLSSCVGDEEMSERIGSGTHGRTPCGHLERVSGFCVLSRYSFTVVNLCMDEVCSEQDSERF